MSHRKQLQKDKKLWKAIKAQEEILLQSKKNIYLQLCSSIISQQLSTKVAAIIYHRFLDLFGKKIPTAKAILAVPFDDLKAVGLSNAKTNYVQNVCSFFIAQKLTDARLQKMEAEEVIKLLTQIKGVGRWTAEMILMFSLGHEDCFPADDLGIQQGMKAIYNLETANKKQLLQEMNRLAESWKPYRTYASMYIWRWKDGGS